MASSVHSATRHANTAMHVRITGLPISDYSRYLLGDIALQARLPTVRVTNVHRTVPDQARIFYEKHVVQGKPARYKNHDVAGLIEHARQLHAQRATADYIKAFLVHGIHHVHGGPASVSRHIGTHPFTEVFDVAHYTGPAAGVGRIDFMTGQQARAFLLACRGYMPLPISRLGHSAELGFELHAEFADEQCFHFEVKQLMWDGLEQPSATRIV